MTTAFVPWHSAVGRPTGARSRCWTPPHAMMLLGALALALGSSANRTGVMTHQACNLNADLSILVPATEHPRDAHGTMLSGSWQRSALRHLGSPRSRSGAKARSAERCTSRAARLKPLASSSKKRFGDERTWGAAQEAGGEEPMSEGVRQWTVTRSFELPEPVARSLAST